MRPRGFTIIEALLTGTLLLMLLGVAALLIADYARILRTDERQQAARNLLTALEQITTEVRLAVVVSQPTSGSITSQITLERVRPQFALLPSSLPSPPPGSWNPQPAGSRMTVVYDLSGTDLRRRASASGLSETGRLASEVSGLAARILPNGCLEIEASINQNGVVRTLRAETWCPSL